MDKNIKLSFSAIDKYLYQPLETLEETEVRGQEYIKYGENNHYPDQLLSLYNNVPTLHSAIESCINYILGDEVKASFNKPNADDTWSDLLRYIAFDYILTGSFAINVLRNNLGMVVSYNYVPVVNLRSDKKNENFWYSEDWSKSYGRVKSVKYPAFKRDSVAASSIFYYKNSKLTTYGTPFWSAAVNACETERRISEHHLNETVNGFSASYIVNLNNGVPSNEQMAEIEQNFDEKFNGTSNSGRLVIAYNNDKEHEATIQAIPADQQIDKYNSAVNWCREQILTAFRCHPVIIGVPTQKTAFNDTDFQEAYALFSKSVIQPLQMKLVEKLNDLIPNLQLEITPFSIDFSEKQVSETIDDDVADNIK